MANPVRIRDHHFRIISPPNPIPICVVCRYSCQNRSTRVCAACNLHVHAGCLNHVLRNHYPLPLCIPPAPPSGALMYPSGTATPPGALMHPSGTATPYGALMYPSGTVPPPGALMHPSGTAPPSGALMYPSGTAPPPGALMYPSGTAPHPAPYYPPQPVPPAMLQYPHTYNHQGYIQNTVMGGLSSVAANVAARYLVEMFGFPDFSVDPSGGW